MVPGKPLIYVCYLYLQQSELAYILSIMLLTNGCDLIWCFMKLLGNYFKDFYQIERQISQTKRSMTIKEFTVELTIGESVYKKHTKPTFVKPRIDHVNPFMPVVPKVVLFTIWAIICKQSSFQRMYEEKAIWEKLQQPYKCSMIYDVIFLSSECPSNSCKAGLQVWMGYCWLGGCYSDVLTLLMAVRAGSQAPSRSCTSNWIQLDITLKHRIT